MFNIEDINMIFYTTFRFFFFKKIF